MRRLTTTRLAVLCIAAALILGIVGCDTTPKRGSGHDHGSHQH